MAYFALAAHSAFGRRHEAGICRAMPIVGPPFIATAALEQSRWRGGRYA